MACETFEVELSAHASGALSAEDAARVDAHLEACDACRRTLAEERQLLARVALPGVSDAQRSLADETWARRSGGADQRARRFMLGGFAAAAAVALAVGMLGRSEVATDATVADLDQEIAAEELALAQLEGLELELGLPTDEELEADEFDDEDVLPTDDDEG